jgi:putative phosphoesterase
MRIGVVSDTHNNLKNVRRIVELFNSAGVERVIHTGDISQPKTLDAFAALNAPMVGVFGNNDEEREGLCDAIARHGFDFCDPPLFLDWHQRRILVVHDPLELVGVHTPEQDLVLHGHTHRQRIERVKKQLIFNPGECAGHMQGYNSVGVIDLESLTPQILTF